MKKNIYFLILLPLLMFCCKKDEPDPCDAIRINEPVGFKIEEFIYDNDEGREDIVSESADTVLEGNLIRFTSYRTYDSYSWQIGAEAESRTGNPTRVLFSSAHLGKINITLIGKRKPQPDCIPNDDGIDTFQKHIVVVLKDSSKMYGSYQGFNTDNPKDTFTIEIKDYPKNSNSVHRGKPCLYNLPNGCMMMSYESSIFDTPIVKVPIILPKLYLAYTGYYSDELSSGYGPCGVQPNSSGELSNHNQTITIKYLSFYADNDGATKFSDKIFIGTRIK